MKQMKRLWMPVLLGVLLMSALVGVAGARPNARPEASPALQDHMIDAHHCIPDQETTDYDFGSPSVECDVGDCYFVCPIKPPHEGLIRVQRLAMYAYDNNTPGNVCIWLTQTYPKTANSVPRVPQSCTSDSPSNPTVYAYNPANFKVSVLQDLFVWVSIDDNGQHFYGAKLKYEPL